MLTRVSNSTSPFVIFRMFTEKGGNTINNEDKTI